MMEQCQVAYCKQIASRNLTERNSSEGITIPYLGHVKITRVLSGFLDEEHLSCYVIAPKSYVLTPAQGTHVNETKGLSNLDVTFQLEATCSRRSSGRKFRSLK